MQLVDSIRALPKDEQLEAALDVIRDLTGGGSADVAHWSAVLGMERAAAVVFSVLWARQGAIVSTEVMLRSVESHGFAEWSRQNMSVALCKCRRQLAAAGISEGIKNRFGQGYFLTPEAIKALEHRAPAREDGGVGKLTLGSLPEEIVARRGSAWTPEDDGELRRMFLRGDAVSAIAWELERSERACLERLRALGLRNARGDAVAPVPASVRKLAPYAGRGTR